MSSLINLRLKFQKCFFFVTFLPNPSVDNTSAPAPDFLSPSPSMLTRITQPACADLLEGLPGGGVWSGFEEDMVVLVKISAKHLL